MTKRKKENANEQSRAEIKNKGKKVPIQARTQFLRMHWRSVRERRMDIQRSRIALLRHRSPRLGMVLSDPVGHSYRSVSGHPRRDYDSLPENSAAHSASMRTGARGHADGLAALRHLRAKEKLNW